MKNIHVFFLILISIIILLFKINSKVTYVTFENFIHHKLYFLDKFCYDNLGEKYLGTFRFEITTSNYSHGNIDHILSYFKIQLYDDEKYSFPRLIHDLNTKKNVSCFDLISPSYSKANFPVVKKKGEVEIEQVSSQWYWFSTFSACGKTSQKLPIPETIFLKLTWLNPGGFFRKHFSKDLQGIFETHIFFTIFLFIVSCVLIVNVIFLIKKNHFHNIIKLYVAFFFVYYFGILLSLLHYFVYALNGIGIPTVDDLGIGCLFFSEILMVVELFLIASGWKISFNEIRWKIGIIITVVLMLVLYTAVFLWANIMLPDYSTQYIFEDIPGYFLVVLKLGVIVYFWVLIITTLLKEKRKKTQIFYIIFGSIYTVYLFVFPIMEVIAVFLPPYYRAKTVMITQMVTTSIAMCLFTILFWFQIVCNVFNIEDRWHGDQTEMKFGKEDKTVNQKYNEL